MSIRVRLNTVVLNTVVLQRETTYPGALLEKPGLIGCAAEQGFALTAGVKSSPALMVNATSALTPAISAGLALAAGVSTSPALMVSASSALTPAISVGPCIQMEKY